MIGARDERQLGENLAAVDLELTADQRVRIDRASRPRRCIPSGIARIPAIDRPDRGEPYLRLPPVRAEPVARDRDLRQVVAVDLRSTADTVA